MVKMIDYETDGKKWVEQPSNSIVSANSYYIYIYIYIYIQGSILKLPFVI